MKEILPPMFPIPKIDSIPSVKTKILKPKLVDILKDITDDSKYMP